MSAHVLLNLLNKLRKRDKFTCLEHSMIHEHKMLDSIKIT